MPVPEVESLAELNELVEQWERYNGRRRIESGARTIDECFEDERSTLLPLPEDPFETGRVFTLRVDRYGQITVRANRYSVPVRLIGKRVRVLLHASHPVVCDKNVEVARHERLIAKGSCRLEPDHYLEALVRKPGAFPARPRSTRPAPLGSSPRSTTPGGPRRSGPTATPRAPGL
ncbi:Mu transposase domain-containing protein [Streptomyces sp. NPDC002559]